MIFFAHGIAEAAGGSRYLDRYMLDKGRFAASLDARRVSYVGIEAAARGEGESRDGERGKTCAQRRRQMRTVRHGCCFKVT